MCQTRRACTRSISRTTLGVVSNYLDLRDRNRGFEDSRPWPIPGRARHRQGSFRIWGFEATGNYFDVLGIQPYLGRLFHPSDERGLNSAPYIVLTYAYWHSHFQDDRGVVGRAVRVNSHPYTILGVTPPDFRGTFIFFAPNFYVPMVNQDQIGGDSALNNRNAVGSFRFWGI